jgi:hypothetical protein
MGQSVAFLYGQNLQASYSQAVCARSPDKTAEGNEGAKVPFAESLMNRAISKDNEGQNSRLRLSIKFQSDFETPSTTTDTSNSDFKINPIIKQSSNGLKETGNLVSAPKNAQAVSTKNPLKKSIPLLVPTERDGRMFLKIRLNNSGVSPIVIKPADNLSVQPSISTIQTITLPEPTDKDANPSGLVNNLNDSTNTRKRKLPSISESSLSTPPSTSSSDSFLNFINNDPVTALTITTPVVEQNKPTIESTSPPFASITPTQPNQPNNANKSNKRTPKRPRPKPTHDKDGIPLHPHKRTKQVKFTRAQLLPPPPPLLLPSPTSLATLRADAPLGLDDKLAAILLGPSLAADAQWLAMTPSVRTQVLDRIGRRLHTFDAEVDWFAASDEWRLHVLEWDSVSVHARALPGRRGVVSAHGASMMRRGGR